MEYSGNGDEFRKKFLELIEPYHKYWYLKNSVPTLDDHLRGRIVLIRAYDANANNGWGKGKDSEWPDGVDGGGLEWNGFNIDGISNNKIFKTQNGWQAWSGTYKGAKVEEYIKAAQQNAVSGFLTLNFASYASDSGPGPNAQGMNERLQGFLKNYRPDNKWGTALGIIPMDFIGNTGDGVGSLENLIIEHQLHQEPNTSYVGIPEWLITASA
jgi:1-phosphatidylinositol phosphodiesterase